MSDRVTNAEVEDVLSSIRRLVSEDHRSPKRPARSVQNEVAEDSTETSSRLVLTAALRVPEPDPDDVPVEQPKSGMSIDSLVTDDTPLDVYHPNFAAAQNEELEEDDTDQPSATDVPDADDSDVTETFDTTATAQDSLAEMRTDAASVMSDVSTIVPAEVVALDSSEGHDDDPVDDADPVEESGLTISQADEDALAESDVDDTSDETPAAQSVKAVALGAKIAALETAIGKISDTWEPDDAGESDYAGTQPEVMAWEDEKPEAEPFARPMLAPVRQMPSDPEPEEASVDAATEDAAGAPEETPMAAPFATKRSNPSKPLLNEAEAPETAEDEIENDTVEATDEDVLAPAAILEEPVEEAIAKARVSDDEHLIDEEALRDLVSDIVRAELQGALGERITRNVRKLVRREIHRALVAQELE